MSSVDSGRYFITICSPRTNVHSNQQRMPTSMHLERCTDLLSSHMGLCLICCYLMVFQRCYNSGKSSSTCSLQAVPRLGAKPHTSLLRRATCPYTPSTPSQTTSPLFAQLPSVFSPQMYQRWKLSALLAASVHIQVMWRNQMPKPLNINTHSTSQDVYTCTTGEHSPGDQEAVKSPCFQ